MGTETITIHVNLRQQISYLLTQALKLKEGRLLCGAVLCILIWDNSICKVLTAGNNWVFWQTKIYGPETSWKRANRKEGLRWGWRRWEGSSDQLGFVGHVEIRFVFLLSSPCCLPNSKETHGTFGAQKRHDLILIFRRCFWCCVGNELLQYSCLENPMDRRA